MASILSIIGTITVEQSIEQIAAMRIALITIGALAASNLLLVILMSASRKKKANQGQSP